MPILSWIDPENFNPNYLMRSLHLLPQLLPLREPKTYLFYSYVADRREVMLRYVDVGREADVTLDGRHIRAIPVADRIGARHVALGSDFDGATIPAELRGAAGIPRLLDALADAGFGGDDLAGVAWKNWRRVLASWWTE